MSSYFHFSDTFNKPWPGEETPEHPQGRPLMPVGTCWRKNPSNVVLPKEQALFLPLAGVHETIFLRAMGRYTGASVGGDPDPRNSELPTLEKIPSDWKVVAFVMNPYERLVNAWLEMIPRTAVVSVGEAGSRVSSELAALGLVEGMPFCEFVTMLAGLYQSGIGLPARLRPQRALLDDAICQEPLFVGRLEHLEVDFREMCRVLGMPEDTWLPLHSSGCSDWQARYTQQVVEAAFPLCAADAKCWGYSPPLQN
jgi:hypothetical protein